MINKRDITIYHTSKADLLVIFDTIIKGQPSSIETEEKDTLAFIHGIPNGFCINNNKKIELKEIFDYFKPGNYTLVSCFPGYRDPKIEKENYYFENVKVNNDGNFIICLPFSDNSKIAIALFTSKIVDLLTDTSRLFGYSRQNNSSLKIELERLLNYYFDI
jgi:hypothetical protein